MLKELRAKFHEQERHADRRQTYSPTGIVLGSWKPETWNNGIKPVAEKLQEHGIHVLTPRDTRLTRFALPDYPGFYYLESDLEEAGLSSESVRNLSYTEAARRLNFRSLEKRLINNLISQKEDGLTYVVTADGRLGKSTGNELLLAILLQNKIALSEKVTNLSTEITPDVRRFLSQILPQLSILTVSDVLNFPQDQLLEEKFSAPTYDIDKSTMIKLIDDALTPLLRKTYTAYNRPENEWETMNTARGRRSSSISHRSESI